jgi:hypothetical protein
LAIYVLYISIKKYIRSKEYELVRIQGEMIAWIITEIWFFVYNFMRIYRKISSFSEVNMYSLLRLGFILVTIASAFTLYNDYLRSYKHTKNKNTKKNFVISMAILGSSGSLFDFHLYLLK